MKRVILTVTAVVVAAIVGFLVGGAIRDDSALVASLQRQTAELTADRDRETDRAQTLADQLDAQDADITRLEAELASQEGPQTETPSAPDEGDSLAGLRAHEIGKGANVGQMRLTPTAFTRLFVSGGVATYHAVVSVKNNGADSISPFCGDSGAELADSTGRTFDPESVIDDSSNNCEDVQPGLTMGNFKIAFRLPAAAKPAILRLWGDYANDALPEAWRVKK